MDMEYKDILKFTLREEIARIESHVSALGAPTSMQERSLIARYGKLLLVCQCLMEALSRVTTTLSEEAASAGVSALRPASTSRLPGKYVPEARPGFRSFLPKHN